LLISLLDVIYLGRDLPSLRSLVSLFFLLCGAIAYTFTDSQFEVRAYWWVIRWYIVFCVDQILIKHIVDSVEVSTWSRSLLTNALACIPVFFSAVLGEEVQLLRHYVWTVNSTMIVLASCVVGVLMSLSSFSLRSAISATYFTVVGTTCKILSVFVNYFMWDKHASGWGLFCLAVCIGCALAYEQAPMRDTHHLKQLQSVSKVTLAKISAFMMSGIIFACVISVGYRTQLTRVPFLAN